MAYQLSQENFERLKTTFKKDTGLDAKDNIQIYITYFQARMADNQMQILSFILEEIAKRR